MIVLIFVTVISCLRSSIADTGASVEKEQVCQTDQFCITLTEQLTAEAGLCVVIPCFFSTNNDFTPKHLVWFKSESKPKCSDSNRIFHSNKNNIKDVQSGFIGRVSLLEPDVGQNNCSIIINDLRESDSGSYQVKVKGLKSEKDGGFTCNQKTTVTVKGLKQKPTVTVPPLAAGHQTTLTCTAPGLCSGSVPNITWMWRKTGDNHHITGNITAFKTENITAVTQRHSSTLTFNSSAEHHGTEVTCKVSFTGNVSTEETVTLNVTYVNDVKITGDKSVKEGETLNLTCTVDSFPPSFVKWTKPSDQKNQNGSDTNLQNDTLVNLQNVTDTNPQEESGTATLTITNVTAQDSGQYICTAKHLNNTLMGKVDVTVIYLRSPGITGNTTVKEGNALNLTCSVESFPPSLIMWTKLDFNTTLHSGNDTELQNMTGSATLFIPNVTEEQTGQYICTVKHLDTTLTVSADVTVTLFPKIINSHCELQSSVLTCVCISDGFPLPTITWPLLENHTEYSVITTVSNHTVNSTVTLTVKDLGNRSVKCVASNKNGETRENLTIQKIISEQEDKIYTLLKKISQLETIIAFLIGVLLSAILCCITKKCYRKKQKNSGNLDETLQMVSSKEQQINDCPTVEELVEDGAVTAATKLDSGLKDVEYASINFSLLKRKSPRVAANSETKETEYAEIKIEVKEEREDADGKEGETSEDKEKGAKREEVKETQLCVLEEESDETQHGVPQDKEGEDMAVYSNVKEIMSKM